VFPHFFVVFVVPRLELMASHLLGRHSATWAMASVLVCLSYFSDRLLLMPWSVQDQDPPVFTSHVGELQAWVTVPSTLHFFFAHEFLVALSSALVIMSSPLTPIMCKAINYICLPDISFPLRTKC
jgi:hypothetical protein